jgi:hypothetical protein
LKMDGDLAMLGEVGWLGMSGRKSRFARHGSVHGEGYDPVGGPGCAVVGDVVVGEPVGDDAGEVVGEPDGDVVGDKVVPVGEDVGDEVIGEPVGHVVRDDVVGKPVGKRVGDEVVGEPVGDDIGDEVAGVPVGEVVRVRRGGGRTRWRGGRRRRGWRTSRRGGSTCTRPTIPAGARPWSGHSNGTSNASSSYADAPPSNAGLGVAYS